MADRFDYDPTERIGVQETETGPAQTPGIPIRPGAMTALPALNFGESTKGLESPEVEKLRAEAIPPEAAPGMPQEKSLADVVFKWEAEGKKERDRLVELLEKNADKTQFAYDELKRTKNPIYQEILQTLKDRGKVQMPPLLPLPQPPGFQNEFQHQRQGFLGFAAMAGLIFFGRRSRGSLTTALNAYAGIMQGIAQNNKEAATQEMERWKAAMTYTLAANKQITDQYNAVLKSSDMDLDTKFETLKLIAASEGDELGRLAAERKNIVDMGSLIQKNEQTELRGMMSIVQMMKLEQVMKAADAKASGGKQTMSDEDLNELVDEYHKTGRRPQLSVFGFRQAGDANRTAFQSLLTQRIKAENWGPDWQRKAAADWTGEMAGARTGGVRSANLDILLRKAEAAIPLADEASRKVPRGSLRRLNDLQLRGREEISDPNLRVFAIQNLAVAEGWAATMNPTGIMRESDRSLALENLRRDESQGTYSAALRAVDAYIKRERKAVQGFREHTPVDEGPALPSEPAKSQFKEGERFESKDGPAIVFRNGRLIYEETGKLVNP